MNFSKDFEFISNTTTLKKYTPSDPNMKELILPEGIEFLRSFCFKGTNIETIYLPLSLKEIGMCDFRGMDKLKTIYISKGTSVIDNDAFNEMPSLVDINVDEDNTCFCSEDGLLYNKAKTIFIRCPMGKKGTIQIREGVKEILKKSFLKCENITDIRLPDTLQTVGEISFNYCTKLTHLNFGSSINSINPSCFNYCDNLEHINISSSNTTYSSEDDVVYIHDGSELKFIAPAKKGTLEVWSTVDYISPAVFRNTKLSKIIFHDNFDIGHVGSNYQYPRGFLAYSDNVEKIELESPYREVLTEWFMTDDGEFREDIFLKLLPCFYPCHLPEMKLVQKYLPNIIKLLHEGKDIDPNWKKTWVSWIDMQKIEKMYPLVLETPLFADVLCENAILTLHETNFLIKKATDAGVTPITGILLNYQNEHFTMEERMEERERELSGVVPKHETPTQRLRKQWKYKDLGGDSLLITGYKGTEKDVEVPLFIGRKIVIGISDFAFSPDADNITTEQAEVREAIESITIPDGVLFVCPKAFDNCLNLKEVYLPSTLQEIDQDNLVDHVGLFSECPKLKYVDLPEGLEDIPCYLFANSKYIKEVTIPSTIESIRPCAFQNCQNLRAIDFTEGVRYIDHNAFDGCLSLTSVELPMSLVSIGDEAFARCISLTDILIPPYTQSFGKNVFENCQVATIVGAEDSDAEKYAKDNNIPFEKLS